MTKFKKVTRGEYEATNNQGQTLTIRRSGASMDGDWLLWIDGEYSQDFETKKEAVEYAASL